MLADYFRFYAMLKVTQSKHWGQNCRSLHGSLQLRAALLCDGSVRTNFPTNTRVQTCVEVGLIAC
eukprot:COSAG02_NODE_1236_length_13732_cov_5.596787_9_plen_65_part_00